LQAAALELSGYVCGGLAMPFAAGFAALQLIVGEEEYVGPPALGVGCGGGGEDREC
jgi:hypothetical protein